MWYRLEIPGVSQVERGEHSATGVSSHMSVARFTDGVAPPPPLVLLLPLLLLLLYRCCTPRRLLKFSGSVGWNCPSLWSRLYAPMMLTQRIAPLFYDVFRGRAGHTIVLYDFPPYFFCESLSFCSTNTVSSTIQR